MKKVNHNGIITPENTAIFTAQNRAFRYGDALFESIRMFDGRLPFLPYHYERLLKGMKVLGYDIPAHYEVSFFENEIRRLIGKTEKNDQNHRIRLSVYRADGGLYTPESDKPIFIIEHKKITDNQIITNKNGLKIGLYDEIKLPLSPLSNLKTSNALPYILAARFCKKNQLDDCIVFNQSDRIAETYKANIFLVKKNKIYTPPISEGCIEGIMRRVIIEFLHEMKNEVIETPLSQEDLKEGQGIFISNATRGVQWVAEVKDVKNYEKLLVDEITKHINTLIRR